jgi:hypothetical protein
VGITASDEVITKVQVLVAHTVDVLDPDNDLVSGTDGPPGDRYRCRRRSDLSESSNVLQRSGASYGIVLRMCCMRCGNEKLG